MLGDYEPILADEVELNPALVAALTRLRDERPIQAGLLSIYGNAHTLFALVKHPRPFDFVLAEQPELPLDPESELIPEAFVEAALRDRMTRTEPLIAGIARHFPVPLFQIESSPPVRSAEHVLATRESVFWDVLKLGELGVAPDFLRYKLWRLHSRLVREVCDKHGVTFVAAPSETQDADGFLVEAGCTRGDATHGNAWYGEHVLRQLYAVASTLSGEAPRPC
jgi:hypothetical protein